MNRVLICSDFLATRESEQLSNLDWLARLIFRPLRAAVSGEVEIAICGADELARFGKLQPQSKNKQIHHWVVPDAIDMACLTDELKDTLVVGYELSNQTRDVLRMAQVPWVDIWLHPVRFASDIMFAFGSSDPKVAEALKQHRLQEEYLYAEADLVRVSAVRGGLKSNLDLLDGCSVFAEQMPRDKSVLTKTGFETVLDHREAFAQIARSSSHLYVLAHPNVARADKDVDAFYGSFSNVSRLDAPSYRVLSDTRVNAVASLSSSLSVEAHYFGCKGVQFIGPPFPLDGSNAYVPVLQKLAFAHFWADVLEPLLPVTHHSVVSYVATENRHRNALSFHWGHKDLSSAPNKTAAPTISHASKCEVASFDVFDTLIQRKVFRAQDVFLALHARAHALLPVAMSPKQFVDARVVAEKTAKAIVGSSGREEPRLDEIWSEFLDGFDVHDDGLRDRLCDLEIASETELCTPRKKGGELFDAARRNGQKIILVSDMYLPKSAIEGLLRKCGYSGWDKLYVSSETGKTKRSGALFQHILDDLDVSASEIAHVGDNAISDFEVAKNLGISAHLLDAESVAFSKLSSAHRRVASRLERDDLAGSLLLRSIAATSAEHAGDNDAAMQFGIEFLGPLLIGYATWLQEVATADQRPNLAFLTREGQVMRAVYDALFDGQAGKAETFDLIASRAIAQRRRLTQVDEIAMRANRRPLSSTAGEWLSNEFGLTHDDISQDKFPIAGFAGPDDQVVGSTPLALLEAVAKAFQKDSVKKAEAADARLAAYLKEKISQPDATALVDIGYRGTIQAAFQETLNAPLNGYYLTTTNEMPAHLTARAYLGDRIEDSSKNVVMQYRRVLEVLLCDVKPSARDLTREGADWRAVHQTACDSKRARFVQRAHGGAIVAAKDFAPIWRDFGNGAAIDPNAAVAMLRAYLSEPSQEQAKLLADLEFEDARQEPPVAPLVSVESGAGSIWPEGAQALSVDQTSRAKRGPIWSPRGPYGVLGWRHLLTPIVAKFVARLGDVQDVDHFRDDPIGFFRRLSDPKYRRIGQILYPRD